MKTFKTLLLLLALMVCGSAFSGCVVRGYAVVDEPVVYVPEYYPRGVYVEPHYGYTSGYLRTYPARRGYYYAPPARRYGPPPGAYPPRRR